ncbi:diacylglycerol kinase eta-like, partial [Paramuricea clavata]
RWKKCYFRLQEKRKLCYAKEPTADIFTEVDIQNSSVAETSIKNVNNSFSIIMPYLTIILCGDTRREMEEWITALRNITLRNSNSDILDRLSDGHNWYSRSHSRPTLCNVCGELLPGVTSRGLSCEVCTYTVHKQCAVRAVDKCKWTSLETIGNKEKLSEYSDP